MSTNYIDQITDTAGTTHDISEGDSTRIFRATCSTAASTAAKVATLQTSNRNFSLATGVRVAVTFDSGNSATTPTLNVNSTGAKTIAVATSAITKTTGSGTTYNTWGTGETVLFTYDGTYWVNGGSSLSIYNSYNYNNLSNKPTIPTLPSNIVNTITTTAGTHTAITNQKGDVSFNVPTKTSHLTNDSGFITIDSDENVKSTAVTTTESYYLTGSSTSATTTGSLEKHASINAIVTADSDTSGSANITLGNSIASGTAGSKYGNLILYGTTAYSHSIRGYTGYPAANRTIYLPRYAGTMYLTCTSTTSAVGGATTAPVYVDDTGRIQAVTSIPYSLLTGTPTIPTNTDTLMTQAYSTTNNSYPLLMTATSGISSTSSRGATTSILNNQIYANPSTGTITATAFNGAAMATTAYDTANLKNIVESTSDPDTASSYPTGTVWIKYTA